MDFYKYFQKNSYGKSYVEKFLKIVNQLGESYSEESKTYFKKAPNPKGIALESIADASDAAQHYHPDSLNQKQDHPVQIVDHPL